MSTGSFQARRAIYQRQHNAEPQPGAGHAKASVGPDAVAKTAHRISSTELRGAASHVAEAGSVVMNAH